MVKRFMMMIAALAMLVFSSVAFAASNVPIIAALSDGMSVELTDAQLDGIRAQGYDVDIYNGILQPYYFRIHVGGIYTNTAQMVQMDDLIGYSYNPVSETGVKGYRVSIYGHQGSGSPVSFTINPTTGVLAIKDQTLAYWWPAYTGFKIKNLALPAGYTQLGSLIAGGNSMMSPGRYITDFDELAFFYQNNTTGDVYVVPNSAMLPNGMSPNTHHDVYFAGYSMNPFKPTPQTPYIP